MSVSVINGVNNLDAELEGSTVAQVRSRVALAMNVDPKAVARVNGVNVDGSYVLVEDDSLEFVKSAGDKGLL